MPWYRFNGTVVHMRGTKLPKACAGHILRDGKEVLCLAISGYLCDHPDGGGRTCDKPLCEAHAHQVGPDKHYCQQHRLDTEQPGLFTGLTAVQTGSAA